MSGPRELLPGADIPQLTGVRAVAAWMVFVFHNADAVIPGNTFGTHVLGQFYIGVNMFFVLSGFLIPWCYAQSMTMTRKWWFAYARNRVARIYPLATLATVFWLGGLQASGVLKAGSYVIWLRCLTLTQALFPSTVEAGPPQSWTLTVEECFYFLVPFLVILCRRRSPWIWVPLMTALFWAVGLCIYGPGMFLLQRPIFGRCFEFFVGMAMAQWMSRRPRRIGGRLPIATAGGAAGIGLGVFLLAYYEGHGVLWAGWPVVNNFYLPVAIAVFYYGLMVERSPVAWLLASRPMIFCGKISYAFYLIHVSDFNARFQVLGFGLWERFFLLMILSALLHLGFELPLRKLIRGRSRSRVLPQQ